MTRVFIVAPTPLLRAGLRMMLGSAELQVVGDAAELPNPPAELAGAEVLLVVASDSLPQSVISFVANYDSRLALVVLSEDEQLAATLHALPLRGWGIVQPDAPAAELQAAVNAATQGLIVLPRLLVKELIGQRLSPVSIEVMDSRPLEEPLTAREQEVLELLSQGLSNKLIARQLQISEHTVKFHVSSLYTKLEASSRAEAVSRGARFGLITF